MGCCFSCPDTGSVDVIARFGKFKSINEPGLTFVNWTFGERVVGNVSMRLQELQVACEAKTKDNVFVQLEVSVQYRIIDAEKYFYRLTNPRHQMQAYVFDVIRALVPNIDLDDVFTTKDEIAHAIQDQLSKSMAEFGMKIVSTPVTNVDPDVKVKAAMNEIVRMERLKQAAIEEGEATRIRAVKTAEAEAESIRIHAAAEAESTYLQGEGMARQRHAIISGMRRDVMEFSADIDSIDAQSVIEVVLTTQYFNTLRDLGQNSNATTIFVPSTPNTVGEVAAQVRNGFLQSAAARRDTKPYEG